MGQLAAVFTLTRYKSNISNQQKKKPKTDGREGWLGGEGWLGKIQGTAGTLPGTTGTHPGRGRGRSRGAAGAQPRRSRDASGTHAAGCTRDADGAHRTRSGTRDACGRDTAGAVSPLLLFFLLLLLLLSCPAHTKPPVLSIPAALVVGWVASAAPVPKYTTALCVQFPETLTLSRRCYFLLERATLWVAQCCHEGHFMYVTWLGGQGGRHRDRARRKKGYTASTTRASF